MNNRNPNLGRLRFSSPGSASALNTTPSDRSDRKRRTSVAICVLLVIGATLPMFVSAQSPADDASPPDLQTDPEARKDKIDEIFTDMTVRRDRLLRRFAVVLHGEYITVGGRKNPLLVHPIVMARVVDQKRDFDLKAMYLVLPDLAENGDEIVKIKGETKYRDTATLLHGPYQTPPEGMSKSERRSFFWNRHAWAHDPYDDYILGANALTERSNYLGIEQAMRNFRLIRSDSGIGGTITSHWSYMPSQQINFRHRIDFSPADQWMPIRFSSKMIGFPSAFQECRYHWKKTGDFLLPDRIQLSMGKISKPGNVSDATFRCHWLIGDDVPEEIFTSEDHLAVLLDQFEIPHSKRVDGQIVRAPHPLPEGLYEGLESLLQQEPRPKR